MTTREAFNKGTDAFNAHDIEAFAAVLTDDVIFDAPGASGRGKTACAGFYGSWFSAFPDACVQVHKVHIIDDVAIEEGTFTGTSRGVLRTPTGDVAPTGMPVRVDYIQVLLFRGGKHASFRLMFDRLSMFEQLGLVATLVPKAAAVDKGTGLQSSCRDGALGGQPTSQLGQAPIQCSPTPISVSRLVWSPEVE